MKSGVIEGADLVKLCGVYLRITAGVAQITDAGRALLARTTAE